LRRRRVVLDACVLYPPALRDFLLTLAALDGYVPIWSDRILAEVERNVLEDNPNIDAHLFRDHTLASMKRVFPHAAVDPVSEEGHNISTIHVGDRHVALTAIAAKADTVLTANQRHFPKSALRRYGVEIFTLGDFVRSLITADRDVVAIAIQELVTRWRNPPHTTSEIVDLLSKHPTLRGVLDSFRE
jgi:PIN domain